LGQPRRVYEDISTSDPFSLVGIGVRFANQFLASISDQSLIHGVPESDFIPASNTGNVACVGIAG
jgi:hypothetical protein